MLKPVELNEFVSNEEALNIFDAVNAFKMQVSWTFFFFFLVTISLSCISCTVHIMFTRD